MRSLRAVAGLPSSPSDGGGSKLGPWCGSLDNSNPLRCPLRLSVGCTCPPGPYPAPLWMDPTDLHVRHCSRTRQVKDTNAAAELTELTADLHDWGRAGSFFTPAPSILAPKALGCHPGMYCLLPSSVPPTGPKEAP